MRKRLILAGLALFLVGAVDVMADEADGATGLHWASYHDDLERADQLIRAGAHVNAVNDQLIRAGAHVNAVNDLGVTPLWTACVNGSAAMVRRLLEAGANPKSSQRRIKVTTALMAATGMGGGSAWVQAPVEIAKL
jgi:uncharacterized protein